MKNPKTISLFSGKGGVGKSCFAAFLGESFARRGLKTLIVEAIVGSRDIENIIPLERDIVYNIEDLLEGRAVPSSAVVLSSREKNLGVISGTSSLGYTFLEQPFLQFISYARNEYDVVIIDTPSGFTPLGELCAKASDLALVLTVADYASMLDGANTSLFIKKSSSAKQRLIINKVTGEPARRGDFRDLDDIIDRTGVQLIGVMPKSLGLAKAVTLGKEIPPADNSHKVFDNIAGRILGEYIELAVK